MPDILCIPSKLYLDLPSEQMDDVCTLLDIIDSHGQWLSRDRLEQDENYLQIIPYTAIVSINDSNRSIFFYTRTPKGGDSRLHHKGSVGIGGHIDYYTAYDNMSFEDIIVSSTIRELEEETNVENIEPETDMQFLTVIHDRSNAVGRVHVGLGGVVIVEPTMDVKSNEPEKIVGSMTSLASLRNEIKKNSIDLEIWSDILLQNIGY